MLGCDLLDCRSYLHVFLDWDLLLQRPIEPCSTYLGQVTHALDTRAALHWHHSPDLVVDAFSPELPSLRRRASTFCKAPLKKSASTALSARRRFNWLTSFRSVDSREFCG